MNATTTNTPKTYVAYLAAYNAGILHGAWIDFTLELDDILTGIQDVVDSSPVEGAEEWALHDFDNFGKLRLGESESIEQVHEIALFIEEHEDLGCELLAHFSGDLKAAKTALKNDYGEYESLADYARELTEETSDIPKHLENDIDYDAIARDIELNGKHSRLQADGTKSTSSRIPDRAYDEIHCWRSLCGGFAREKYSLPTITAHGQRS